MARQPHRYSLTIDFSAAPQILAALAEFAAERADTRERAALVILDDWLVGHGYLPPPPALDESSPTDGNA